jgi:tetratricopeptide (TPR) repeat protein
MNFFRSLNKEQWTALSASAVCALMLLFGFSGGISPAAENAPSGAEETYEAQKQRHVELPDEKIDRYGGIGKIFQTESAVKLAIPLLKSPDPREEEMPAPAFRPGPVWESYNRLAVAVKYPVISATAPLIADANLLHGAEITELCKTPEPAATGRPDRRAEKEREFAIITMRSGKQIEVQAITGDYPEGVTFRDKAGKASRLPKSEVMGNLLYNRTYEDQYKVDSEKIKPGPKETDDRVKLARACLELGMIPEAKAELKKAIELKKDNMEAILLIGQVAVESADFETAIAAFRGGLDAGGPAGELWYEIGRCMRMLSFSEGALLAFEKAVEAAPRLHAARIALARALLEVGQHADAAAAATDFFTKLGAAPDTTPAQKAEASLVRGLAFVRGGQLDKAKADFADTIKVDPNNAEALNGNGAALALEGQFPQAVAEFVKAIKANQYLTEAWTNLATLYLLGGKWAEAEQLCAAAAQRDPSSAEALLGQGLAQLMAGNKDGPKLLDRAAQVDPRNLQVQMAIGLLRLREGQDEDALLKFVGALRQEYHFLPAYSGAAAAYLRTGRKLAASRDDAAMKKADESRVNASTLLQSVRDFNPNNPGPWAALGCAYAVMNRPGDARQALRQAQSFSQNKGLDPLIFYTLGYIEYYYGNATAVGDRLDDARREFEQGVKLKESATDPFSQRVVADCETAIAQIDSWKKTALRLLQNFDGPDAKSIGPGWIESKGYNIQISRAGGRGKFAGKQVNKEWGLTSLSHEIPGEEFNSLEITFFPEKVEKAEFGLSIFTADQGGVHTGFSVGVDEAGKVRLNGNSSDRDMDGHDMAVGWADVKVPLPNPKEITLRVSASEKNRARYFNLSFWSPEKGDWITAAPPIAMNANARVPWRIAAWVRAWKDRDVVLYVDNIKVLDQARR